VVRRTAGRLAEKRVAADFLSSVGVGGPSVLGIVGPEGVGRTTLWRWVVAAGEESGCLVLRSRPGPDEGQAAYGVLADLFRTVGDAALADLPHPQGRALSVALLRAPDAPVDIRAVCAGALAVLVSLARERPVVLAVDDLHWADRSTLRVIEYVARRVDQHRVGLVISTRPSAPAEPTDALPVVLATVEAETIQLEHLDVVAFGQVLEQPVSFVFLSDQIEALVALGELDMAWRLADHLGVAARRLQGEWALAAALRCRALVHAARGEADAAAVAADQAVQHSDGSGMDLEKARTLLIAGRIARRAKHKQRARQLLEESVQLFAESGCDALAVRAADELARVGGGEGELLTATETQVAGLSASGNTNRQVAALLGISPKTVEANLSRIYRKLDIHSRAQLGGRLGRADASDAVG
jgi:DNA-binding CsgD family transcriptional regulator